MRSAHCKLGMAIIAPCLSFPTGLWRSKHFLWGSCRPPGKLRRRGLWGKGTWLCPLPGGLAGQRWDRKVGPRCSGNSGGLAPGSLGGRREGEGAMLV